MMPPYIWGGGSRWQTSETVLRKLYFELEVYLYIHWGGDIQPRKKDRQLTIGPAHYVQFPTRPCRDYQRPSLPPGEA
jgi:hypothetical protein